MAAGALVAPKVFVAQALAAEPSPGAFVLDGVRFQRLWLQGVLVAATPDCAEALLDDGSGVLLLRLPADARAALLASGGASPAVGRAVLVVGRLGAADAAPGARRALKVSKLVQLDGAAGGAQREALWALEVAELWRTTLKLLPPAADGAAPASA